MKKKRRNEEVSEIRHKEAPQEGERSPLDTWSWGAFSLTFIWGIGNKVRISLLALIPGLNIIMMFVLGLKGRRWAWERSRFMNENSFLYAQESWDRAGFFLFAISAAAVVVTVGCLIGSSALMFWK